MADPAEETVAAGSELAGEEVLIAEGFGVEVPKGYVYFAMGFAMFVELLNVRLRHVTQRAVTLRVPYIEEEHR